MPDVIVLVPTFRRPRSLERLLLALESLQTKAAVRVLVADNDAERHEGFDLCLRLIERGYTWPLETFVAHDRGIAQVRNALVERALKKPFDFIAMLDDDEWPQDDWLDSFLAAQLQTGADALQGRVTKVFDREPSVWAQSEGRGQTNRLNIAIPLIEGTGNTLIARRCVESLQRPYFDPEFALTGGEDRDFFVRLQRDGRKFARAGEAVAFEHVPASRATLKWTLSRAYRIGNSDMRVFLKYKPRFTALVRESIKLAGAFVLCPILLVAASPIPGYGAAALCKLSRAAGKLAAMFGRYYNEYSVTHGT